MGGKQKKIKMLNKYRKMLKVVDTTQSQQQSILFSIQRQHIHKYNTHPYEE